MIKPLALLALLLATPTLAETVTVDTARGPAEAPLTPATANTLAQGHLTAPARA